ncbi:MAG: hypothetical protein AAGK00_12435 [Pseudomonadota bacterium]
MASIATAVRGDEGIVALVVVAPSFGALLFCFFMVINVQMARATMDSSVASQTIVRDTRKQHEELMRSFRRLAASAAPASDGAIGSDAAGTGETNTAPGLASAHSARPTTAKTEDGGLAYRGVAITQESPHRYVALGKAFSTLADAEVYIDFSARSEEPVAVNSGQSTTSAPEALAQAPQKTNPSAYRGIRIEQDGYKLLVEGRRFSSLESAKQHIDALLGDDPVANGTEPARAP